MENKENADIQKWWEVPCIAQFFSLFGAELGIPNIDIDILERILLNHGVDAVSGLSIHEIVVALLRGIYKSNRSSILIGSYEKMLRRFIRQKCLPISMDLGDDFDIYTELVELPVRNQVLILHSLCYIRLEPEFEHCEEIFKRDSVDRFRAEPLGEDSVKSTYWYFGGMRLYKDEYISEDERLWGVICFSEEDWLKLLTQFENSRNANEKNLFLNLQEKLPDIHKIHMRKVKVERFNRYTVSGAEISNGNLIETRTRSRRVNSTK